MPVAIKSSRMEYKDDNGNYIGVDAVSERTTAEQVAEIEAAGDAKVQLIQDKADAVTAQLANAAEVRNMLAGVFDPNTAYVAGQYVIQTVSDVNKLFRFTVDHPAGSWIGTDAVEVKLGDEVTDLKSAITDVYDNSLPVTMTDGYMIANLTTAPQSNAESSCTDFVAVTPGRRYHLKDVYLSGTRAVNWYYGDANKTLGGTLKTNTSETSIYITIEHTGARYIRATGKYGIPVEVGIVDDIEYRLDGLQNELTDDVSTIYNTFNPIAKNAKSIYSAINKYGFPAGFGMTSPVDVYTDGYKFITDFDADDYKNVGGATWYVAPVVTTGDGSSVSSPCSIGDAISHASAGDTIVLQKGTYYRDTPGYAVQTAIQKSLNIIGNGSVLFDGNFITFSKTSGYTYVYNGTRSLAKRVIDVSLSGKYIPYTKVSSIEQVDATPGSYYISGSSVYVHSIKGDNPSTYALVTVAYEKFLEIDNENANVKVYVENVTLVGKFNGILIDKKNTSNSLQVCFNDVSAVLCGDETTEKDAFMIYGGNVVFYKCKALSSYKDGFNYSGRNTSETTCDCHCVEIECVGAGSGHESSNHSMNGSTAHQGAKVIRINGRYYDCNGGNVADVQTNTKSVNLGCLAYAPFCTDGYSQNFAAQQSGTEIWLDSCIASGALYDLFCASDATIHAVNTGYETKSIYQTGTLDETHKRTVTEMMLLKGCLFSID